MNAEIIEKENKLTATFDASVSQEEIKNYTFIWYLNNKEIDSAWTQTITPQKSGLYSVEIFNKARCSIVSEQLDIVVSINEDKFFSGLLNVYPNPNNGSFEIEFLVDGTHKANISVLDIEGKLVKEINGINFTQFLQHNIDISSFANGIYFVRVVADEYTFIQQIVKQ